MKFTAEFKTSNPPANLEVLASCWGAGGIAIGAHIVDRTNAAAATTPAVNAQGQTLAEWRQQNPHNGGVDVVAVAVAADSFMITISCVYINKSFWS